MSRRIANGIAPSPVAAPVSALDAEGVFAALLTRMGEAAPEPRLDATRRALELLGDPHLRFPFIHVTGTNGKTSTTRMAAELLRGSGLRVGTFTSPHLMRFNERIAVDGDPASDAVLSRAWHRIEPALERTDAELRAAGDPAMTFFEALTVLMFDVFADEDVDAAVIEVGMGGEWDSTNVADGRVAVLAPIALDHTRQLGATVAEIAHTKSGIIKPGSIVVSAQQSSDALERIRNRAERTQSTLLIAGQDFAGTSLGHTATGQTVRIRRSDGSVLDRIELPLYGVHQADNAALAIAAVDAFLSIPMAAPAVVRAMRTVSSPGRLQVIGADPLVVLDAAHNPAGARSLARALQDWPEITEFAIVLGALEDKDASGIIDALRPAASLFLVTQSDSPRAIDHLTLARIARRAAGDVPVLDFRDPAEAIAAATAWATARPAAGAVVTGSITLVGDALVRRAERS